MSTDLIELDENRDGQDINLEMRADHAWLIISSRTGFERYHLTPDSDGLHQAQTIINGIQSWIDYINSGKES